MTSLDDFKFAFQFTRQNVNSGEYEPLSSFPSHEQGVVLDTNILYGIKVYCGLRLNSSALTSQLSSVKFTLTTLYFQAGHYYNTQWSDAFNNAKSSAHDLDNNVLTLTFSAGNFNNPNKISDPNEGGNDPVFMDSIISDANLVLTIEGLTYNGDLDNQTNVTEERILEYNFLIVDLDPLETIISLSDSTARTFQSLNDIEIKYYYDQIIDTIIPIPDVQLAPDQKIQLGSNIGSDLINLIRKNSNQSNKTVEFYINSHSLKNPKLNFGYMFNLGISSVSLEHNSNTYQFNNASGLWSCDTDITVHEGDNFNLIFAFNMTGEGGSVARFDNDQLSIHFSTKNDRPIESFSVPTSKNLITYQSDLAYNGRVGYADLALLDLGKDMENNGYYDLNQDINQDGVIDIGDLIELKNEWGSDIQLYVPGFTSQDGSLTSEELNFQHKNNITFEWNSSEFAQKDFNYYRPDINLLISVPAIAEENWNIQ